jgi:hypothetical protein
MNKAIKKTTKEHETVVKSSCKKTASTSDDGKKV